MKYLSVCAGIEAATVAWHPLGWTPVAFSEIEKFPNAVLEHHYPDVPNYGDMNEHEQWPGADVDVLVGGTPCQSFSVAGLRKGMADPRGNLALIYLAIADQFRPRWLVWENVPGVLSSDGGRDFGSIIGGMVELGYSPSWRVLDAQYFGVAQRRRRVFVVASSRDWRDSAEVLFEPESLLRHPPPGREARQEVANALTDRPDRGGTNSEGQRLIPEVARTLTNNSAQFGYSDGTPPELVASPLNATDATKWGSNQWVDEGKALVVPDISVCMTHHGARSNDPELEQMLPIGFAQNQRDEVRLMDKAGALAAEPGAKQQTYLLHGGSKRKDRPDGGFYVEESEVSKPLDVAGVNPTANQGGVAVSDMAVRRLTPLECERLQGFPDNYTNIPKASDGARYKALGNSMAVPVMHWIGARIDAVEKQIIDRELSKIEDRY